MNHWPGTSLDTVTLVDPETLPAAPEILDGLTEPVVVADARFVVVYANPSAERVLGVRPGEGAGRCLPDLVPGRYTSAGPEVGNGWRFRRHSDGWIAYGVPAVPADDGPMQHVIEAEQLVAVGQLAAGVAHEIGAPLTAISVAVEYLIRSTAPEAGDVRRDLELILSQTQRISRLTRRLVDLARPAEPDFRPTDLNAVVRESVDFVERQLRRDGVRCITVLDGSVPPVRGDAQHLQQVLLNLLLNAHRAVVAVPDGERRIDVRTRRHGTGVELTVSDVGPGIDADDLHRIFLPFYSRAGSTGMGLTVVWNIVHQHGGTVEVRSEPRRGATFVVRLPGSSDGQAG